MPPIAWKAKSSAHNRRCPVRRGQMPRSMYAAKARRCARPPWQAAYGCRPCCRSRYRTTPEYRRADARSPLRSVPPRRTANRDEVSIVGAYRYIIGRIAVVTWREVFGAAMRAGSGAPHGKNSFLGYLIEKASRRSGAARGRKLARYSVSQPDLATNPRGRCGLIQKQLIGIWQEPATRSWHNDILVPCFCEVACKQN